MCHTSEQTTHTDNWMQKAIELSANNLQPNQEGFAQGGPFGAVIIKDGKLIAQGVNQVTSTCDPTAHAEIVAIRNACRVLNTFDLSGCEMYSSCEPCPMCLAAIYWARLDKVFYANTRQDAAAIEFDDENLYQEVCRPVENRQLPMQHFPSKEALEVFKAWQQLQNKTHY